MARRPGQAGSQRRHRRGWPAWRGWQESASRVSACLGGKVAAIEKMFPQFTPGRPVVIARNDLAGSGWETFGNGLHAGGETVFAAVADKNRQGGRWRLEPAIDATLRVGQLVGTRLPGIEAAGPGDGVGRQ